MYFLRISIVVLLIMAAGTAVVEHLLWGRVADEDGVLRDCCFLMPLSYLILFFSFLVIIAYICLWLFKFYRRKSKAL